MNLVLCIFFIAFFQTKRSNFRHRPIGLGVQGLADAFMLMRLPFDSPAAQKLNVQIFETIYYGALEAVSSAYNFWSASEMDAVSRIWLK